MYIQSSGKKIWVVVIGDGRVIREYDHTGDFVISELIDLKLISKRSYVRVMVSEDSGGLIVTNPLFVDNVSR